MASSPKNKATQKASEKADKAKKASQQTDEPVEEIQVESPEEAVDSKALLEAHGYTVGKTLGSGSYSTVKLVSKEGHTYACKIVCRDRTSPIYRLKFLPRELQILGAIRHPNITYVSQIIDEPSKVFIIMELASGGDLLEKILKVKRFKERRAYEYFMQMAKALAYLHYKDIAHRDLKCDNVLLTSTNVVKLADFSFARYCTDPVSRAKQLSATYCGSEAYAPPEVLQGVAYRPKMADVWSLGVILFVMVTGLLPYESDCVPRQVRLQMTRTLHFPQVLPLTNELKNLIRGMLEPVQTLRSSMARVFRHPWVKMFPTAMQEMEERMRAKRANVSRLPTVARAKIELIQSTLSWEAGPSRSAAQNISESSNEPSGKRMDDSRLDNASKKDSMLEGGQPEQPSQSSAKSRSSRRGSISRKAEDISATSALESKQEASQETTRGETTQSQTGSDAPATRNLKRQTGKMDISMKPSDSSAGTTVSTTSRASSRGRSAGQTSEDVDEDETSRTVKGSTESREVPDERDSLEDDFSEVIQNLYRSGGKISEVTGDRLESKSRKITSISKKSDTEQVPDNQGSLEISPSNSKPRGIMKR